MRFSQSSLGQARIRISEPVWRYIVGHSHPPAEGRDLLQCKLDRLVHENPDATERILVTHDQDLVDLLRDWCAWMLADAALLRRARPIEAGVLAKEANRTIALIDRYDNRMMEADRVFGLKKTK